MRPKSIYWVITGKSLIIRATMPVVYFWIETSVHQDIKIFCIPRNFNKHILDWFLAPVDAWQDLVHTPLHHSYSTMNIAKRFRTATLWNTYFMLRINNEPDILVFLHIWYIVNKCRFLQFTCNQDFMKQGCHFADFFRIVYFWDCIPISWIFIAVTKNSSDW